MSPLPIPANPDLSQLPRLSNPLHGTVEDPPPGRRDHLYGGATSARLFRQPTVQHHDPTEPHPARCQPHPSLPITRGGNLLSTRRNSPRGRHYDSHVKGVDAQSRVGERPRTARASGRSRMGRGYRVGLNRKTGSGLAR